MLLRFAPQLMETAERQDSYVNTPESLDGEAPSESFESIRTILPTHDEIAKRAYEIYLQSGEIAGRCEQNWCQAERELLTEALYRNGL